jgi:hypothetical protein
MEDFTLPRVGARFKMDMLYIHSPKLPQKIQKINLKNQKIRQRRGNRRLVHNLLDYGPWSLAGRA